MQIRPVVESKWLSSCMQQNSCADSDSACGRMWSKGAKLPQFKTEKQCTLIFASVKWGIEKLRNPDFKDIYSVVEQKKA